MIDQNKVRVMHRMAVAESGTGERKLKIGSYTLVDFIVREVAYGIIFGVIAFMACLGLWLCMTWDDINIFFKEADYVSFIHSVGTYFVKFMAVYLVVCAVSAFIRHRNAKKYTKEYLVDLKRAGGPELFEQGD